MVVLAFVESKLIPLIASVLAAEVADRLPIRLLLITEVIPELPVTLMPEIFVEMPLYPVEILHMVFLEIVNTPP